MNEEIMRQGGFGAEVEKIKAGFCPFCDEPISLDEFRDQLSRREYEISGLCQSCQDDFFGVGKPEKRQDKPPTVEDMVYTPLFGNLPRGKFRYISSVNLDDLSVMEQADLIAK